jgi:hypothetical protein
MDNIIKKGIDTFSWWGQIPIGMIILSNKRIFPPGLSNYKIAVRAIPLGMTTSSFCGILEKVFQNTDYYYYNHRIKY